MFEIFLLLGGFFIGTVFGIAIHGLKKRPMYRIPKKTIEWRLNKR